MTIYIYDIASLRSKGRFIFNCHFYSFVFCGKKNGQILIRLQLNLFWPHSTDYYKEICINTKVCPAKCQADPFLKY